MGDEDDSLAFGQSPGAVPPEGRLRRRADDTLLLLIPLSALLRVRLLFERSRLLTSRRHLGRGGGFLTSRLLSQI